MSDGNPFDDLAVSEDETDEPDESGSAEESVSVESGSPTESTAEAPDRADHERERQTPEDEDLSEPAFEYSEVRQRPLYARGETWDRFEDELGITVIPGLRTEGIRDEEKRELHDAALEVAARHADELLEVVVERRRQS